jgi:GABA permease
LDSLPAEPAISLAHTLQPRHVSMISLGGIIGAGLFVGSSAAIATAGPSVLITYTLCGTLVFLIMRMLGEMAVARPGLGSFAEYSAASLGHWAGFMTGWLYWYFWVITVGVETIAGATLLSHWIAAPVWIIGLTLIAAMTATNLLSVRMYGECEFWFAFLKVASITLFIVIGLGYIFGFGSGFAAAVHILTDHGGLFPRGLSAPFLAIPTVIFSMMGSEVATIAAAETADPAANVARSARTVSLRILVFYVASIALIVSIVPWNSIVPGDSPFTRTMNVMHIPGASLAMQMIVITAVLSCLNSGLYVTSRMMFELARRGDAPAILTRVSKNQVPRLGILLGSTVGFLAALSSIFSPTLVFLFLINTSGAIILFIYLLIVLGEIRMRRQLEAQGETLKLKMWLFPVLSYVVAASIIAVFVMMAFAPGQFIQVAASGFSVLFIFVAFLLRQRLAS